MTAPSTVEKTNQMKTIPYWLEALESSLDEHGCFDALTEDQREAVSKDLRDGARDARGSNRKALHS